VAFSLGSLQETQPPITGEPVICNGCGAALSALSSLTADGKAAKDSNQKLWNCEFCSHSNQYASLTLVLGILCCFVDTRPQDSHRA
jgi:hypothetical protein